jgi:serine/threonine-protein kinase
VTDFVATNGGTLAVVMMRWITVFLFAVGLVALARAESWRTYSNERFGTTADVPFDWRPGPPPENGDGLVFTSPDGQASIAVYGSLHVWDTIDQAVAMFETPSEGETITYKRREPRSIVISGTRSDRIYYAKSILSCRDNVWNSMRIEYPAARKEAFDLLVKHVAGSLRSGHSYQVAECNKTGRQRQ